MLHTSWTRPPLNGYVYVPSLSQADWRLTEEQLMTIKFYLLIYTTNFKHKKMYQAKSIHYVADSDY